MTKKLHLFGYHINILELLQNDTDHVSMGAHVTTGELWLLLNPHAATGRWKVKVKVWS